MADIDFDGFRVTKRPKFAPKDYMKRAPVEHLDDCHVGSGVPLRQHPSFKRTIDRFAETPNACGSCESLDTLCIYYSHALGVGYDSYAFYELKCQSCSLYTTYGHSSDGCSGY